MSEAVLCCDWFLAEKAGCFALVKRLAGKVVLQNDLNVSSETLNGWL